MGGNPIIPRAFFWRLPLLLLRVCDGCCCLWRGVGLRLRRLRRVARRRGCGGCGGRQPLRVPRRCGSLRLRRQRPRVPRGWCCFSWRGAWMPFSLRVSRGGRGAPAGGGGAWLPLSLRRRRRWRWGRLEIGVKVTPLAVAPCPRRRGPGRPAVGPLLISPCGAASSFHAPSWESPAVTIAAAAKEVSQPLRFMVDLQLFASGSSNGKIVAIGRVSLRRGPRRSAVAWLLLVPVPGPDFRHGPIPLPGGILVLIARPVVLFPTPVPGVPTPLPTGRGTAGRGCRCAAGTSGRWRWRGALVLGDHLNYLGIGHPSECGLQLPASRVRDGPEPVPMGVASWGALG